MQHFNRRTLLTAGAATAASALTANSRSTAAEEQPQDVSRIGKTPHTRFAVNIEMWWRKLPFLDRIKKAAELGFPAVEFWPYANKDLDAVAQLTK